ncbi:MAG: hypothetical protein ACYC8V_01765 [Caulobacteraceae bacterium]
MAQIDLDDLPPRLAEILTRLEPGEELVLVQNGALIGRLTAAPGAASGADQRLADAHPEERMKEVLEQFNAMIHDQF